MNIGFKISSVSSIIGSVGRISAEAQNRVNQVLAEGALSIYSDAIKSIQSVSRGEEAVRYSPKRRVIVSKPGDAPNRDTGRLSTSIAWDVDTKALVARVGTNLPYGAILELSPNQKLRRPWLTPAYRKNLKSIQMAFRSALKGVSSGRR